MLKQKLLTVLEKIKKLRPMHYFALGAFSIILIEATLLLAPSKVSNAVWIDQAQDQHYTCGSSLHVVLHPQSQSPSCSTGYVSSMTSYNSVATLKADPNFKNAGAYTVVYGVASYWCDHEDPSKPCLDHLNTNGGLQQHGLTGDGSASVTLSGSNASSGQFAGQACGYYQNDFGFYIYPNGHPDQVLCGTNGFKDSHSISSLGTTNSEASWCHTGTTCKVPTPTPTHVPSVTPTVTPTMTPSVTNTPTPTGTVTPTPPTHMACRHYACVQVSGAGSNTCSTDTECVHITNTPTPTVTVTPTPSETLTPTVTPTGTLTPTETPTMTPTGTVTPTETLTPTGTITPVPSATVTPLPPAPITETPKTGPSALIWMLELVGALPLGLFIRKNAKLK